MAQDSAHSGPSLAAWLKEGAALLGQEEMAEIRRTAARRLENELRERREEIQRMERELAEIAPQGSAPLRPVLRPAAVAPSLKDLVLQFAKESPGSQAGAFVEWVTAQRPGTKSDDVHGELYRLSRPNGPALLRKEGKKPSKYFLGKGANRT